MKPSHTADAKSMPNGHKHRMENASTNKQVKQVLKSLSSEDSDVTLNLYGAEVELTSLDKTLWPAGNDSRVVSKRDFLVYLTECSAAILPHVRNRPLTLARYPNGIEGQSFIQRHWHHAVPDFVETLRVYSDSTHKDDEFLLCNNLPTLLWLGQIGDLELHTWFSRDDPEPDARDLPRKYTGSRNNIQASQLNFPDFLVFDLDPYIYSGKEKKGAEPEFNTSAFAKVCEVAIFLKEALDGLGWNSFVKTSGKTGLHIYVPVVRLYDFEETRRISQAIGKSLMDSHPDDITMDWSTAARQGKIFLDHNMNVRGKTIASVYSPRANPHSGVSTPLRWDELGKIDPREFTIATIPKRLKEVGDLWHGILESKNDLGSFDRPEGARAA